jgi:hypothetical protein
MLRINLLRVVAVAAVFVVGVFAQKPDTAWYNATDVVFEIATADQLAGLAQIVNSANSAGTSGDTFEGKTIILTNDIDLSAYGSGYNRNKGWIPIGGAGSGNTTMFRGVFDGNGKIISGLYINDPSRDWCGLFGDAMPIATIKNIGIVGGNITGRMFVGGISGGAPGNITNCYFTGEIRGTRSVGGVVGHMWSDTLTNCYSAGVISGSDDRGIGGVVGTVNGSGIVANCYSTAAVSNFKSGGGSGVGGVVGGISDGSLVVNCYSTGAVSGGGYDIGGVVGSVHCGTVLNCYSTGAVSGKYQNIGGVVGNVEGGSVVNCYSTGAVSGRSDVGGVVGNLRGYDNCLLYTADSTYFGSRRGDVNGCAALNPSVITTSTYDDDVGRRITGSYGISGNIAFAGMLNGDGNTEWARKGADDFDGADIFPAEILGDGTLGGRFTGEGGWTTQNGKLPGLFGNTVDMPEYLYSVSVKFAQRPKQGATSLPRVSVKGGTLNISIAANTAYNIRLVDMRGRTSARFSASGSGSFSLSKLPSGRYMVEAKAAGTKTTTAIIVQR